MVLVSSSWVMDASVADMSETAGGPRASILVLIPIQADWLILVLVSRLLRACHIRRGAC